MLSFGTFSQGDSSVAVANPNVEGLYATPEMCAKMIRLELAKLNKYSVYDKFDMQEVYDANESYKTSCLSKTCLVELGQKLGANYMITGSFDLLGNKIVITLKMIDVANTSVYKSGLKEFTNQEKELQRMIEVLLTEMLDIPVSKELNDRLKFDNDIITKASIGKVSNSGPRVGVGVLTGSLHEYATRDGKSGLDIFPAVSMIGYQLEAQYVGTDNFSALAEFILNVNGLEQGKFLPTLSILNGFRFGDVGWEFAFGPGFTLTKTSTGDFVDGEYTTYQEYRDYWQGQYDVTGEPSYEDHMNNPDYLERVDNMEETLDDRADIKGAFMFVMAFGRTFRAGALNIPVNIFYSSRGKGGIAGLNVGFNVTKKKTSMIQGL